jgi:hypothetical protein
MSESCIEDGYASLISPHVPVAQQQGQDVQENGTVPRQMEELPWIIDETVDHMSDETERLRHGIHPEENPCKGDESESAEHLTDLLEVG